MSTQTMEGVVVDANKDLQLTKHLDEIKPNLVKKVLDEETYTENVEDIIVRDFFPDHEHLKDQNDYLEAEERKDFEKMRQIALKYAAGGPRGTTPLISKNTPLPSPASFETPIQEPKRPQTDRAHQSQTSISKKSSENNLGYKIKEDIPVEGVKVKEKDKRMGLDQFLSNYTSEDNDSFESILKRSDEARRLKHAWLYEAEQKHAETTQQVLQLEGGNQPLAITDGSQQDSSSTNPDKNIRATVPIHTWDYKNKNSLMYYPEGLERSDDEVFKKPLLIKHENTRFKQDPFHHNNVRSKLTQKMNENGTTGAEKIGPDGKSVIPQESPRVKGFGFVATPSPMPGVDDSPLMTWGEIESTPARIEPTSTPGPAFRFPEESEREKLTHKMVDANTKKHRAKKEAALKQMKASVLGTPNRMGSIMRSDRINTLSPAARRLVSKRFNMGTDKALKASYTPTSSQLTQTGAHTPIAKTPTPRKTPKNTPTPGRGSITDDLLHIPNKQRKTAADFF